VAHAGVLHRLFVIRLLLTSMALLWVSAALSATVDNIPYAATMSPVVAEFVDTAGGTSQSRVLWWSLALGQRRGARHRRTRRPPDLVLAVHPVRPDRRRGHDRDRHAYLWLRYFVLGG
jgi:hypothetical protein